MNFPLRQTSEVSLQTLETTKLPLHLEAGQLGPHLKPASRMQSSDQHLAPAHRKVSRLFSLNFDSLPKIEAIEILVQNEQNFSFFEERKNLLGQVGSSQQISMQKIQTFESETGILPPPGKQYSQRMTGKIMMHVPINKQLSIPYRPSEIMKNGLQSPSGTPQSRNSINKFGSTNTNGGIKPVGIHLQPIAQKVSIPPPVTQQPPLIRVSNLDTSPTTNTGPELTTQNEDLIQFTTEGLAPQQSEYSPNTRAKDEGSHHIKQFSHPHPDADPARVILRPFAPQYQQSALSKLIHDEIFSKPSPRRAQSPQGGAQPAAAINLKDHATLGCYSLPGKRFNGETNINQDAYTIMEDFYEITPKSGQFSKLMLLADGHGPDGHLIAQHSIQIFPQIFAKHLTSQNLMQYQTAPGAVMKNNFTLDPKLNQMSGRNQNMIHLSQTQSMNQGINYQNRWEIKKKKQSAIKKALLDSFDETHKTIVANNYYHDSSLSGTTLVAIFITDENLVFTANVGDTWAMLFQIEKDPFDDDIDHTLLTIEHEPLHQREFKRLKRQGGEVIMRNILYYCLGN